MTHLALQPNPTNGQARLEAAFGQPVNLQVAVVNLLGQQVWATQVANTTDFTEDLDLSGFADGIYLVRLTADGQTLTKKLVKSGN